MPENNQPKKKSTVARPSLEFSQWVERIMQEFEKKRGFRPSYADITTDIKRQFQGQFQV